MADGQSASQSWCRVPSGTHDQIFSPTCWLLWPLFSWGALSDERVGLSFVGSLCHVLCRVRIFTLHIYICTICTRPLSVQALWSRCCAMYLRLKYFVLQPRGQGRNQAAPVVEVGRLELRRKLHHGDSQPSSNSKTFTWESTLRYDKVTIRPRFWDIPRNRTYVPVWFCPPVSLNNPYWNLYWICNLYSINKIVQFHQSLKSLISGSNAHHHSQRPSARFDVLLVRFLSKEKMCPLPLTSSQRLSLQ
jgi:hypothetical protein